MMKHYILQILIFPFLSLYGSLAFPHESHHQQSELPPPDQRKIAFQKINDRYIAEIKPIFEKKCFDCHSEKMKEPWYRNWPGAKQLIDYDIREAKEHLDMSNDFPFKGHAGPLEDLESIEDTVSKNEMPPFRYWILHPDSRLSESEKKQIQSWIDFSKSLL